MGKITTTFQFDEELYYKFRAKCKNEDVSMVSKFEVWIRNYLQQPKDDQEIKNIESQVDELTVEQIRPMLDRVKQLYDSADNPIRQDRMRIIAARLKDRYKTLTEQKGFSNSEAV
jgi:hypothetical protein